mgnify:CR=1 FL=1
MKNPSTTGTSFSQVITHAAPSANGRAKNHILVSGRESSSYFRVVFGKESR